MRILRSVLLLPFVSGLALGQEEPAVQSARSFEITRFTYDERFMNFEVSGKSRGLPDGTRLAARITLDGAQAAAFPLFVGEGVFETNIPTEGRRVLPGTYVLTVTARRDAQSGDALAGWPEDLEEDVGSANHAWQASAAASTIASIREDVIGRVEAIRLNFDLACQLGYGIGRRIDQAGGPAAIAPAARDALLLPWREFLQSSEAPLVEGLASFRKDHYDGVFVSPIQDLVEIVVGLYQGVIGLRSAYTVEILTKLQMAEQIPAVDLERGRFSSANLIAQIFKAARAMQQRLGPGRAVWAPIIKIGKERYNLDGKTYVSATSRFRIQIPGENWQILNGEANATERVTFQLLHRGVPIGLAVVHMVEFPAAETPDERVAAWIRLAEYEWPKYRFVSGEWVNGEDGEPKYYLFKFRSRSDDVGRAHVTCYLHVPENSDRKGLLYGVMVVSFLEGVLGELTEDELEKTALSFQLDK